MNDMYWYTLVKAQERLAAHGIAIKLSTLRRSCAENRLPASKNGGEWKISNYDLDDIIKAGGLAKPTQPQQKKVRNGD